MQVFDPKRIGDYFRIKHGYAFKGEFFASDGDHVLLTPGNFEARGGLKLKGEKEKYYTGPIPEDFVLERGDLLIAMTDLTQNAPILGAPAFVPESGRFLHNQRLGKVVDINLEALDAKYLYYILNWSAVRDQIKATATGATVRHTAPERIYAVTAPLPPVRVQRHVADVLSAYDDLIENNTSRIKILKEMAGSLYREWFVDFRFPGHEKATFVTRDRTRIPADWRLERLGDRIELAYGKALKETDRRPGSVPVYGSSGIVGWHDTSLADGPGIIVGRKGNVGSVHWSPVAFFPIDTVFFVRCKLPLHYVYFNLQLQKFLNNDAAVPGLSRNQAYALPLLVPPAGLLDRFEGVAADFFAQASLLRKGNERLREVRDLLLPRLISGEIELGP